MTDNNETELCIACAAYLAHYPIMVGDHDCQHTSDETAFMLALADAVHGPNPEGEFVDPGWRAAMFLDDAELALDCGPAPYSIRIHHPNDREWETLAIVNDRYLIGYRSQEGAEGEYVADLDGLGLVPYLEAGASERSTT